MAAQRLQSLYPAVGPWAEAALWHGRWERPVPTTPVLDELDELGRQKLVGLLLRYARAHQVRFPAEVAAQLQGFDFAWTRLTAEVIRPAAEVIQALAADGIGVVVSKGPGIAACYSGPGLRPYGDIDLLVPPDRFSAVVRRLDRLGWIEEAGNQQPWPYFVRRAREGVNLRRPPTGSLDLHHRLPPWIFTSGLPASELIARAVPVSVAGCELPVLSRPDNLLVAALHIVSDRNQPGGSLIVWRDLVELAAAVDTAEALERAQAAGLAGWLRSVLLALPAEVRPVALLEALGTATALPHPRRLDWLLSRRADRFGVVATQFLRLPLANGLGLLAGVAVPSPSFLRQKYPAERHRYRRWWSNRRRAAEAMGPAQAGKGR